jgi:heme-degrading monooxygenase HmoA
MMDRTRVMIWHREPPNEPGAIEEAYRKISHGLSGTPGLLGNELLRSTTDPGQLLVMSEWESRLAFEAWEEGRSHHNTTSPLRRFQDRDRQKFFEVYVVTAEFHEESSNPT